MANYSHAAELQQSVPPLRQLDYLTRQLGEWAKLNTGLRPLHREFTRVQAELEEAQREYEGG